MKCIVIFFGSSWDVIGNQSTSPPRKLSVCRAYEPETAPFLGESMPSRKSGLGGLAVSWISMIKTYLWSGKFWMQKNKFLDHDPQWQWLVVFSPFFVRLVSQPTNVRWGFTFKTLRFPCWSLQRLGVRRNCFVFLNSMGIAVWLSNPQGLSVQ